MTLIGTAQLVQQLVQVSRDAGACDAICRRDVGGCPFRLCEEQFNAGEMFGLAVAFSSQWPCLSLGKDQLTRGAPVPLFRFALMAE